MPPGSSEEHTMRNRFECGLSHALSLMLSCTFVVSCTDSAASTSATLNDATEDAGLSSGQLGGTVEDWPNGASGTVEVVSDTEYTVLASTDISADGTFAVQLPSADDLQAEPTELAGMLCDGSS